MDEPMDMEPRMRGGYQLIGDNMLFRFAEQFLEIPRERSKASVFIGLCISGVKAEDLLKKLKAETRPISEKVVLMVGTNDILLNTDSTLLRTHLHKLVYHLCFKIKVEKLIILTIPPVPRVADQPYHWKTLKEYNEHIKTFHNGKDIVVIDAYPHFIKNNKSYHDPSPLMRSLRGNLIVGTINFDDSNDDQKNSDSDNECESKTTPRIKFEFSDPDLERKSLLSKFHNRYRDDLDDSYLDGSDADEIDMKYFQECIENKVTRPDKIHLNRDGLQFLGELVLEEIIKSS